MTRKLFVGNLPYSTTVDELRDLFAAVGAIARVHIPLDTETQRSRGFGFVEMSTEAEAQAAIQRFDGARLGNRTLVVNEAREKPRANGAERDRYREGGRRSDRRREFSRSARW